VALAPDEVFTPNGFPVEDDNVYAARKGAEAALKEAFSRRQVPVVYGEYGVGKTTLAKRYFRDEDREGRFIHVWTVADKNLDDIAKIALEQIGYEVEMGREDRREASVEGSLEAGVWGTVKARFAGKIAEGETTKRELLVRTPTDQGFLRALADAKIVIALDEMHKASDGFRSQLAELIKASSNQGRQYPRFIVLGTTADASDLVIRDPGIDRLVREVAVAPMTDAEAAFVSATECASSISRCRTIWSI
jgi:AAA ATPase domain